MTMPAQPSRFTWEDYLHWDDGKRWELIDGVAYDMSAAPRYRHQVVVRQLAMAFCDAFEHQPCEVMLGPFDVRLSDCDVVQPDLLVVCDQDRLIETHLDGAPTLAIEVGSPTTLPHDRVRKLRLYQQSGVAEYWLVTPFPATIEILALHDRVYHVHAVASLGETITSARFPHLTIDLDTIFTFDLTDDEQAAYELHEPPGKYTPG